MELFLDTLTWTKSAQAVRMEVISGVTTNPSLAAKEGIGYFKDYRLAVQEIARMHGGRPHLCRGAQHRLHYKGMVLEAREIATVPFKVLTQMAHHPLTDVGVARFLEDWKRVIKA